MSLGQQVKADDSDEGGAGLPDITLKVSSFPRRKRQVRDPDNRKEGKRRGKRMKNRKAGSK